MDQKVLPHDFADFPLYMTAMFAWVGFKFSLPIKVARLRNKQGEMLVEISEDKKNPADFETFLNLLRERVEGVSLR